MEKTDGRRERGEATRRAILDEARQLLSERGTDWTLETLAGRVGLTRQAILHHFPAKERVFVELAVESIERECAAAIDAVGDRVGAVALEAFVRGLVAFYVADVDAFRLVYLRGQMQPDAIRWFPLEERAVRLYPVTGRMYEAAERAVRAGPALPGGADARSLVVGAHLAALGFATMHGVTVAAGDPMKRSLETYLEAFLSTWKRGLAP